MEITKRQIDEIFTKLVTGEMSREEANSWAYARIKAYDEESLEFVPPQDYLRLFNGVKYLLDIDGEVAPGVYFFTLEEVIERFENGWLEL